jgi:DNA-binding response OmpR family regulator
MNILVVEDDPYIGNLIEELLKGKYLITRAFSGTEAALQLEYNRFDLVLLDLMLPGLSGEEVLSRINGQAKVIILSAKDSKKDRVDNLLNGANDYITKPFDNDELLARIEVQLRKRTLGMDQLGQNQFNQTDANSTKATGLTVGDLRMDEEERAVRVCGEELKLTKLEYDILYFLMKHPNHVFSKSQIFEAVWDYDAIGNEESVKVHISNLRSKIAQYSERKYIETVWGIGFKFIKE